MATTEDVGSKRRKLVGIWSDFVDAWKNSGGPFWAWLLLMLVIAGLVHFFPGWPGEIAVIAGVILFFMTAYAAHDVAQHLLPFGIVPTSIYSPHPSPDNEPKFPVGLLVLLIMVGLFLLTWNEVWRAQPWMWQAATFDRKAINDVADPILGYMAAAGGFIEASRHVAYFRAATTDAWLNFYETLAKNLVIVSFLYQAQLLFLPMLAVDIWGWFDPFYALPALVAVLVMVPFFCLWVKREPPAN